MAELMAPGVPLEVVVRASIKIESVMRVLIARGYVRRKLVSEVTAFSLIMERGIEVIKVREPSVLVGLGRVSRELIDNKCQLLWAWLFDSVGGKVHRSNPHRDERGVSLFFATNIYPSCLLCTW